MTTAALGTQLPAEREVVVARGRWAITAVFFLNGLTLGSYIIRLPSLKIDQHLTTAQLGLVATLFGAAALITMQFVGALVARHGSGCVIRLTLFAMPAVLVGIGFSRGFGGLSAAMVALGAVHGTLDVSMNAHAVAVERRLARPILSGCHAAWSVSAVVASIIGGALITAGLPTLTHFVGIAAVVMIAGCAVGSYLLPGSADRAGVANAVPPTAEAQSRANWRSGWSRAAIALGLTGTAVMVVEGAAMTWSGVFLHDSRGASLTLAAMAVTAFTACQTSARLVGDRLTMRYGASNLFRVGGLVATVGLAVAVLSPHVAGAVAGFAIVGLGTSLLLPLTFSAAGHAGGAGPGAATFVARFTTFTYAGILLGPALIGWLAQVMGLQWTLGLLAPLLGAVALLGRLPARAVTAAPSRAR